MTPSEQARADAMADAETLLREVVEAWDAFQGERHSTRLRGAVKERTEKAKRERFLSAMSVARAAFRAVPGLRGDR